MVYTIRVQRHVKMPPKLAIASCTLPYWVVSAHSWSQEPSQNPLSLDNWDHGDPFSFSFPEYGTFGSSWDCKVSIRISCQTCWVTFKWHREKQVEKNHHRTAFGQTVQIRKVGLPESITHFWMAVKKSRKKICIFNMHFWWLQDFPKICIFPWENAYAYIFWAGCRKRLLPRLSKSTFHWIMHFWWFQGFPEICIFPAENAFFCFLANCRQCIFHISLILFKPRFSWIYAFLMVPRFSQNKYFFHGKMHMFAFRLAAELGTSLASVTSFKNKGENARPLKLASVAATAHRVSASWLTWANTSKAPQCLRIWILGIDLCVLQQWFGRRPAKHRRLLCPARIIRNLFEPDL